MAGKRSRSSCHLPSSKKANLEEGLNAHCETEEENAAALTVEGLETNGISRSELGTTLEMEKKHDVAPSSNRRSCTDGSKSKDDDDDGPEPRFIGSSVPEEEAKMRWPHRYAKKVTGQGLNGSDVKDDAEIILARRHYLQAEVDGYVLYNLHDDAHVKAEDGVDNYICRIVEMFEAKDGSLYFTAQWFYRAVDTVIKNAYQMDKKRVFFSEIRNDNPLDCLVGKLKISKVHPNMNVEKRKQEILSCDYYYDMHYLLPYSTFVYVSPDNGAEGTDTSSTISTDGDMNEMNSNFCNVPINIDENRCEVSLLDLYSGCGAMSTGLCLGANLSGLNLITRWAVDINKHACDSLELNHPETQVRNESAEDFMLLLKEWEKLCIRFSLINNSDPGKQCSFPFDEVENDVSGDDGSEQEDVNDPEAFEVGKILQVCYGDPKEVKQSGLYFKVRWKNYGPSYDTWEPIEGLSNCKQVIGDFVVEGYKSRILPLPGDVGVICGGPPCQGISGFNRFRNRENPLEDEKNKQLTVFMEIVDFLRPKYVLMENVVDILKFAEGFLGRYALGRLIDMNYQSRMGMLAAGAYGLPQFRMRVFLWGAHVSEKLPQYPLPTHDVLVRGVVPLEFERNTVSYDENNKAELEEKLYLADAISDLPAIENSEQRDEMEYDKSPATEFQQIIRERKYEALSSPLSKHSKYVLYDHRPLELNNDDYQRVCRIPKKKGANFRDLPGVRVRLDNKVEWDPNVERIYLDSGKPLVPDYAMTFVNGSSSKPFARLWWDETVPTVVTRAEPHNQAILHPEQDRVLSIRENARLQGFPDYYKLCGPIKERYIQVGNAVAVPVSRALGFALGLAMQGSAGDAPVFSLPKKFPKISEQVSSSNSENE